MKLLNQPIGKKYLDINEKFVDVYKFDDVCEYFDIAKVTSDIKTASDSLTFKELKENDKYFLELSHVQEDLYMLKLFKCSLENYHLVVTIKEYFYVTGPEN